jgi:hypothetical protein
LCELSIPARAPDQITHQTVDFTNACSLGRSKVGGGKVVERQKRDEYHLGLDEKGAPRR